MSRIDNAAPDFVDVFQSRVVIFPTDNRLSYLPVQAICYFPDGLNVPTCSGVIKLLRNPAEFAGIILCLCNYKAERVPEGFLPRPLNSRWICHRFVAQSLERL